MDHFDADDGEPIHLKMSGDGSPLVLLHGWTSTHRDWNPFVAALAARHQVFRWDARGQAATGCRPWRCPPSRAWPGICRTSSTTTGWSVPSWSATRWGR